MLKGGDEANAPGEQAVRRQTELLATPCTKQMAGMKTVTCLTEHVEKHIS